MHLGIPTYTAKNISHFSSGKEEVIHIDFKLILQLKLPIIKYKVSSIYK